MTDPLSLPKCNQNHGGAGGGGSADSILRITSNLEPFCWELLGRLLYSLPKMYTVHGSRDGDVRICRQFGLSCFKLGAAFWIAFGKTCDLEQIPGNQYKTTRLHEIVVRFSQEQVDELNSTITTAQEALRWALDNLHPRVAKASSFGAEDAVITDLMVKTSPDFRFFTLDTGRLPQETYDIMDTVRKKYNISIEVLFPDTKEVEEMVNAKGLNLFYDSVENRELCCEIRKVHPMNKMLGTLDGWITGLRRKQTKLRDVTVFQLDHSHGGILKINPIIDWSWDQVQEYIKKNSLPYNSLLDKGYPSIGCEPCTRPIRPGEDLRAGRWWWEQGGHKECGLHIERKRTD